MASPATTRWPISPLSDVDAEGEVDEGDTPLPWPLSPPPPPPPPPQQRLQAANLTPPISQSPSLPITPKALEVRGSRGGRVSRGSRGGRGSRGSRGGRVSRGRQGGSAATTEVVVVEEEEEEGAQADVRASWLPEIEESMLHGLKEARDKALSADGGFKKAGWAIAIDRIFATHERVFSLQQCKSKLDHFKSIWSRWLAHNNAISGWGWDEEKGVPFNDPEVMNSYFLLHPEWARFREKPPPFKDLLEHILGDRAATGAGAAGIEEMLDAGSRFNLRPPSSDDIERYEGGDDLERVGGSVDRLRSPSLPSISSSSRASSRAATTALVAHKRALRADKSSDLKRRGGRGQQSEIVESIEKAVDVMEATKDLIERDSAKERPTSPLAEATALFLHSSYFADLAENDRYVVLDLFENEVKARMYIELPEEMRSGWLLRQIVKVTEEAAPNISNSDLFPFQQFEGSDWQRA